MLLSKRTFLYLPHTSISILLLTDLAHLLDAERPGSEDVELGLHRRLDVLGREDVHQRARPDLLPPHRRGAPAPRLLGEVGRREQQWVDVAQIYLSDPDSALLARDNHRRDRRSADVRNEYRAERVPERVRRLAVHARRLDKVVRRKRGDEGGSGGSSTCLGHTWDEGRERGLVEEHETEDRPVLRREHVCGHDDAHVESGVEPRLVPDHRHLAYGDVLCTDKEGPLRRSVGPDRRRLDRAGEDERSRLRLREAVDAHEGVDAVRLAECRGDERALLDHRRRPVWRCDDHLCRSPEGRLDPRLRPDGRDLRHDRTLRQAVAAAISSRDEEDAVEAGRLGLDAREEGEHRRSIASVALGEVDFRKERWIDAHRARVHRPVLLRVAREGVVSRDVGVHLREVGVVVVVRPECGRPAAVEDRLAPGADEDRRAVAREQDRSCEPPSGAPAHHRERLVRDRRAERRVRPREVLVDHRLRHLDEAVGRARRGHLRGSWHAFEVDLEECFEHGRRARRRVRVDELRRRGTEEVGARRREHLKLREECVEVHLLRRVAHELRRLRSTARHVLVELLRRVALAHFRGGPRRRRRGRGRESGGGELTKYEQL